jgi:hypothetical protein
VCIFVFDKYVAAISHIPYVCKLVADPYAVILIVYGQNSFIKLIPEGSFFKRG